MTSPIDYQTANVCRRDNPPDEADARSAITRLVSEKSRNVNDAADAAWEAEVERIGEPAFSLEDTLRAILDEIADGVS